MIVASGDNDPRARTLNTFNALFPKGAYFGEIGLIGPANLLDVQSLDSSVDGTCTRWNGS